jgi:hypothetical protein
MSAVEKSTYQIQSEAVGLTYMQCVGSIRYDVSREAGLILTEVDVLSILFYVRFGLGLPRNLSETQNFLGYDRIGVNGLEPPDFLNLFLNVRFHTETWVTLERGMVDQGRNLDTFSRGFVSTGNNTLNIINQMPVIDQIRNSVGQTEFPFSDDDYVIAGFLSTWLDDIGRDIDVQKKNTKTLLLQINTFRDTILHKLQPDVDRKQKLITDHNLDAKIKDLSNQIAFLKKDLEAARAEYRRLIGLMFSGVPGGLIGIAVTATIFGIQAARLRREINRKLIEKDALNRLLADKLKAKEALEGMEDFFYEMTIRLQDAEQSVTNLEFVWEDIYAYIENSSTILRTIDEGTALATFADRFSNVIYSWTQVGNIARDIQGIMSDARTTYNRLVSQGVDRVPPELLLREPPNYHQVNLTKQYLSSLKTQSQQVK